METKPFWKTSEFYVLVLGEAGAVITGLAQVIPGTWAAVAGAFVGGAYAVARGLAKSGVPYVPNAPVDPSEREARSSARQMGRHRRR